MKLAGKVVAVTGGFGSLGIAVATAAAAAGAQVALIDRIAPDPSRIPASLHQALLLGNVDLSSLKSAEQALASVVGKFGGLDVLANIAGAFHWQTLEDGDVDAWDLLYAVNLKTAVSTSKAALPLLIKRGGGRIINIGAGAAAAKAGAGMGAYTASKAGVAKLTESLAEEVKDRHINVNAVLPSIIDTPVNRADMPSADFSRWVTAAALADVIVFLASDEARAITGALIPVSGRV